MCLLPATLRAEGVCRSLTSAGWLRGPGGRCLRGGNPAEPPGGEGEITAVSDGGSGDAEEESGSQAGQGPRWDRHP